MKLLDPNQSEALYGEAGFEELEAFFYCEALTTRSERHDWTIHPHRHKSLFQVFLVTEGGGRVQLDDQISELSAPCVLYIPDGVMHGFDWQKGSTGYVVSVASPMIKQVVDAIGPSRRARQASATQVGDTIRDKLVNVCESLSAEDQQRQSWRDPMVMALLQQLLIWIFRALPARPEAHSGLTKPERKVAMFKALIEKHSHEQHQVAWYAKHIGVSGAHLNQICQQYAGSSALTLIHSHLLDEAKRHLIFADLLIATIADRLGFADPTYFNKFFKKQTGLTPATYRQHFRD